MGKVSGYLIKEDRSISKDAQQHMPLRNCKFKQWDTTTHLSERWETKTPTTPNAQWECEAKEFTFIICGSEKGQSLWKIVCSSLQSFLQFTIWFRTGFLGIYPNELKTYVHTKNCIQMFIAVLHNCQNLEALKIPFSRWMYNNQCTSI